MKKSDMKYFAKAAKVASISDFKQVHIGCVAVYKGKIIGIGCNTNKTHPIQKKYNKYRDVQGCCNPNLYNAPKMHAEINCLNQIRHLDINFSKVKLYIYRQRKDREFSIARPCDSCMRAIKSMNIHEIYFTGNEKYEYEKVS